MASVEMNNREIMLKCTRVNHDYMRLPAGKVTGLKTMTALYKRIAQQSVTCAQAWVQDSPCPEHEPATDGFWWAVVAWADAFGLSMGVDQVEWGKVFIWPHDSFANYLRPGGLPEPLPTVNGSPANIIMELDAKWMELVIKLTARWGIIHHLKDSAALMEAQCLKDDLYNPHSPAYKAYLESDLAFFGALFKSFPFQKKTQKYINDWLKRAEEAL